MYAFLLIPTLQIFPLKKLKLEYGDFEAKRNLSNAYDVYLADSRIIRLLPTRLGKHFVGRHRCDFFINCLIVRHVSCKFFSTEPIITVFSDVKIVWQTINNGCQAGLTGRESYCVYSKVNNLKSIDLNVNENSSNEI